jgi:hypothetical protein
MVDDMTVDNVDRLYVKRIAYFRSILFIEQNKLI